MKRIFIVGCRRSGTTWVMMLLAHHPDVVAMQQSSLFLHLEPLTRWMHKNANFGRTVLMPADGADQAGKLERRPLSGIYSTDKFYAHMRALTEDVYDQIAECAPEAKAVVDHQAEHVRMWEAIHATLPEAWFVHVVRDPRSVFSSYRHSAATWSTYQEFSCNPIDFSAEWSTAVEQGRAIPSATSNYVEVSYEKLRENGPEELMRIYQALGLAADREQCEKVIDACTIDKLKKTAHGPHQFFRRGETKGWQRELSRSAIRIVEHQCGALMDELGYERVHKASSGVPFRVWLRERRLRIAEGSKRWVREGDGWFRNALRGVVRKVPALYKLAWSIVRW